MLDALAALCASGKVPLAALETCDVVDALVGQLPDHRAICALGALLQAPSQTLRAQICRKKPAVLAAAQADMPIDAMPHMAHLVEVLFEDTVQWQTDAGELVVVEFGVRCAERSYALGIVGLNLIAAYVRLVRDINRQLVYDALSADRAFASKLEEGHPTALFILAHLAVCPHVAKTAAAVHGRRLIQRWSSRAASPVDAFLVERMQPHLDAAAYSHAIFESPNSSLVTKLARRFYRMGCPIIDAPGWEAYARGLKTALGSDRKHVALLLLQVAHDHGLEVVGAAAVSDLRAYFQKRPSGFSIDLDESDPAQLKRAMCVATALGANGSVSVKYAIALDDCTRRERQSRRLSQHGVADLCTPPEFVCPVALTEMRDPVVASDGHTYERESLQRLLASMHTRSPVTREALDPKIVIPNIALRKRIREYADDVCEVLDAQSKKTRGAA